MGSKVSGLTVNNGRVFAESLHALKTLNVPVHRAMKASEAPLSRLRCNWLLGGRLQRTTCNTITSSERSLPTDQPICSHDSGGKRRRFVIT